MPLTFALAPTWRQAYPGAAVGVLALSAVANPGHCAALDEKKSALEAELRQRFAGYGRAELLRLPALQAYDAYYRRFKKTYHVQLQLESLLLKGKALPSVAALVEAMFMAEVRSQLLTAGHDLDLVESPVGIHVAEGAEDYVTLSGQLQLLKTGDMYIRDEQGILSSIIYGPDARTRLRPETRRALFTVYGVPGIAPASIEQHLQDLRDKALLIAPEAQVELLAVYPA
ncbi:MAG: hypothetical protein ACYC4L_14180 [Chloroflexota bacterium]